ncbi:GTPase IMAP family member 9-like [Labrus bergylta]|uniref:GTPase IMAP family member 9-like n=1 Tax=Labrus bergylta TaxID=56723 RepID=UPI003313D638
MDTTTAADIFTALIGALDRVGVDWSRAVSLATDEPTMYNNEEIRIVMVGKTGAGKSATANTILGKEEFKSRFSFKSVTEGCAKAYGELDGQKVSVIDTPGLFDTNTDAVTTRANIVRCMAYASPGPHIFLILIKLERFTEEIQKTVEKIQKIFGEEANKYSMVLFTHGDQLRGQPIEEILKESEDLQELVAKCNNQYHVFDNNLSDSSQVTELLNKIRKITEKNTGNHYTTEMFQKLCDWLGNSPGCNPASHPMTAGIDSSPRGPRMGNAVLIMDGYPCEFPQ